MKNLVILALSAAVGVLLVPSCKKDNPGNISSTDVAIAEDEVYSEALFQEVDNTVESSITALDMSGFSVQKLKSAASGEDDCMSITIDHPDSVSFPKVAILDFGRGCTRVFRNDTITFKGQIIVTITGRWFIEGSERVITFNNFYINDVKLEGTRTVTNKGRNERNHLEMEIVLAGGKVIFEDASILTRESDHVREWIREPDPLNDTVIVTGSAHGINALHLKYEQTITTPLVLVRCQEAPWRWIIVKGTIEITNNYSGASTIDYTGTGCESSLLLSKNGMHENMPFRYRHHNHMN